jgi:hypothetical protein
MRALATGLALSLVLVAPEASAQAQGASASPPIPPPVQQPAQQPAQQPTAPPAPQYAAQPPGLDTRHWRNGDPIPPGYHVEDLPRSGLVTAGYIVTGIPYFFSVVAALSANNDNESGWLLVPFAGPWVTMGRRNYGCNPDATNQTTGQSLACVADVFVVMGLIFDGIVQATGGVLLLTGYVATKPGLVRNDAKLRLLPMQIGSGTGLGASGVF